MCAKHTAWFTDDAMLTISTSQYCKLHKFSYGALKIQKYRNSEEVTKSEIIGQY